MTNYTTTISETQIQVWFDFAEKNIQESRELWNAGDHVKAATIARMVNDFTADLAVNLTQISRS